MPEEIINSKQLYNENSGEIENVGILMNLKSILKIIKMIKK